MGCCFSSNEDDDDLVLFVCFC